MSRVYRPHTTALLALLLALPASGLAQTLTDTPLSNADIVKMMKAGIPESIILREIQIAGGNLGTSPTALVELKKHRASERILGAVLDSHGGGVPSSFEPEAPYTSGLSTPQRPLRLPSFEADLQVKSKTHSKISMGQNHIEVKQAGVPVFSLKWKEKPSDK